MPCRVRVRGGYRALEAALEEHKRLIYEYNTLLRGTGYYLKPVHIVTRRTSNGKARYLYIGRYWWRLSYAGKKGHTSRVQWIYVGKEKPEELGSLPDPPTSPLQGLTVRIEGDDVVLDEKLYQRYRWLFEGYEAVREC